jgi:hypothetical protein
VELISPLDYRRPDQLPTGGVLVVGASATGIQLADEIHRSGRPVTLSVGEHVRMPRVYRGRDVMWWLTSAGVLDERYDEIDDLVRGRNIASPQLVGTPDRATRDLNALTAQGVALVGRLGAIRDGIALFSGSLRNVCSLADLKLDSAAASTARSIPRTASSRLTSTARRGSHWIYAQGRSERSCGRPAFAPITRGCRYPCSTARGGCVTTAAW